MRKKKERPHILYRKYVENHKEELEKQELKERLNTDRIVVKKVSAGAKIAQLTVDILRISVKVIIMIAVLALLSLAVTVLINPALRKMVFHYLGIMPGA